MFVGYFQVTRNASTTKDTESFRAMSIQETALAHLSSRLRKIIEDESKEIPALRSIQAGKDQHRFPKFNRWFRVFLTRSLSILRKRTFEEEAESRLLQSVEGKPRHYKLLCLLCHGALAVRIQDKPHSFKSIFLTARKFLKLRWDIF